MLLHSFLIAYINLQSSHGAQVQVCSGCALPWLDELSRFWLRSFNVLRCSCFYLFLYVLFLCLLFNKCSYLYLIAVATVDGLVILVFNLLTSKCHRVAQLIVLSVWNFASQLNFLCHSFSLRHVTFYWGQHFHQVIHHLQHIWCLSHWHLKTEICPVSYDYRYHWKPV